MILIYFISICGYVHSFIPYLRNNRLKMSYGMNLPFDKGQLFTTQIVFMYFEMVLQASQEVQLSFGPKTK